MLGSFVLGWLSDRYGRRPVLVFGQGGGLSLTLALMFCTDSPTTLIFTFMALYGLSCGCVGVVYTLVNESNTAYLRVVSLAMVNMVVLSLSSLCQIGGGLILDSMWDGLKDGDDRVYSADAYKLALVPVAFLWLSALIASGFYPEPLVDVSDSPNNSLTTDQEKRETLVSSAVYTAAYTSSAEPEEASP